MGSIPTQTIEQVAAANDIVEVIGSYFPLKRAARASRRSALSSGEEPVVQRQPAAPIVPLFRLRRRRERLPVRDGLRASRFSIAVKLLCVLIRKKEVWVGTTRR
jgi:hypothetical protein